ncbi:MAG: ATP-dependent Clp protease adaptor ClpS [Nitrospiraceae bacterium]
MPKTMASIAIPEVRDIPSTGTGDSLGARVIVFNCDCHTYQQVIALFCANIPGMNPSRAFELAWRIDHEGQATVYSGEWKTAEGIGKKLAAGGLKVVVQ